MNKTKLVLAIGALSLVSAQSTLAAEFTVSGVIDSIYNYNTDVGPVVNSGDRFEVTVTYADNPGSPDYTSTYNYGYGYSYTQSEWYNSIQSIAVAVYDANNTIAYSQTITAGAEGVTYSNGTAGNYTVDYTDYYNDYEQVYFNVYNQTYDGQINSYQYVQLYFWGYTLDLAVDHSQFPQPPDQAMLDSGQVTGQLYTWDYYYDYATGVYSQWQYGGSITAASGVIVTNPDADGDGVSDEEDAFPNDPTESADTDGDGVGDNADQNDNSDLSATVSIDGNNSGVSNPLVSNGLTLADIINTAGAACKATAKNHGAYTSCVGKTLNSLKAAGTITDAEKDALQSTVAKSSFGKK